MISTTAHKTGRSNVRLWAVVFWLAVWQLAAMALDHTLLISLLPSPLAVAARLGSLACSAGFWSSVGRSALRILGGFLLGCGLAGLLAPLSARFPRAAELLAPPVAVVKATPVASFIILALLWVPKTGLSLFISFLMVFPPIYLNLLEGVRRADRLLLEMAAVFRVPLGRRVRDVYLPQLLPWFRSACSLGLGLCWKAGIAAEVIGLPTGSMGERLYTAKIYLETPDLFAWTVAIVAAAAGFEKLFLRLLDALTPGEAAG